MKKQKKNSKKNFNENDHLLNRKDAVSMVKEYFKEVYKKIPDSKRTLYTDYEIKDLLFFLVTAGIEYGADGIRIYHAAVSKGIYSDERYLGEQTVLMVATKKNEFDGINEEIIDDSNKTAGQFLFAAKPGFDFGSLAPPDNRHRIGNGKSIAFDVYNAKKKSKKPSAKKKKK